MPASVADSLSQSGFSFNPTDWKNLLIGVVGPLLVSALALAGYWFRQQRAARRKKEAASATLAKIGLRGATEQYDKEKEFYQRSRLEERTGEKWQIPAVTTGDAGDSIAYFMDAFQQSAHRPSNTYLVLGPTGIGKTMFLQHLHHYYATWSKGKNVPTLLLGTRGSGYLAFETTQLAPLLNLTGGASHDTILLLDALDEFESKEATTPAGFRQEFHKFWAHFLQAVAPRFRTVVLTAREQFFHDAADLNRSASGAGINVLRLQPFTPDQRTDYLKKYYEKKQPGRWKAMQDPVGTVCQKLTPEIGVPAAGAAALTPAVRYRNPFVEVPLLVSFLPDLTETYIERIEQVQKTGEPLVTSYVIMELLVTHWLERERETKNIQPDDLRAFCQQLAVWQARRLPGQPSALTLSKDELEALESEQFKDSESVLHAFGGRGDRSLLTCELVGGRLRFKFLHERFFAYFLAEYLTAHPAEEATLELEHLPAALDYLFGIRWGQTPRPKEITQYKPREPHNIVPKDVIAAWGTYLDGLTTRVEARDYLRTHWREILDQEVPYWNRAAPIQALAEMAITSENYWGANPHVANGARYLRDFVTIAGFGGCPSGNVVPLGENDLLPLSGATNLTVVDLNDTQLPEAELEALAGCAPRLTKLGLQGIRLTKAPAWLARATNLTVVGLNFTQLPEAELEALAGCAPRLTGLWLGGTQLAEGGTDWFSETVRLTQLGLRLTHLSPQLLSRFSASAATLKYLDVAGNPDITAASFTCFGEHADWLRFSAEKNGWVEGAADVPD